MPTAPTTLSHPPPPANIEHRTDRARTLGLSEDKQVTRQRVPRGDQITRIRRMQRLVLGAADEMQAAHQRAGKRYRCAMLTLTYARTCDWRPKQISTLMQRIRDWLARRGHPLRAVWVLELQKRGAPHYHVLIWLPRGLSLPKPDKQGWWPHGHSRTEWARKPAAYMAKYTSKGPGNRHPLPRGARIYGIYGHPVRLDWWRAPGWLREIADRRMRIQRRTGGWWAVHDLAYAWRSPWRVIEIADDAIEIEWVGWGPADVIPLWQLEQEPS